MKYDYKVVQDGQIYEPGDDVPEMGSIFCVESKGNIRYYEGLESDFQKLPVYNDTGSACLMIDTGNYYKFEKKTNKWYLLGGESN